MTLPLPAAPTEAPPDAPGAVGPGAVQGHPGWSDRPRAPAPAPPAGTPPDPAWGVVPVSDLAASLRGAVTAEPRPIDGSVPLVANAGAESVPTADALPSGAHPDECPETLDWLAALRRWRRIARRARAGARVALLCGGATTAVGLLAAGAAFTVAWSLGESAPGVDALTGGGWAALAVASAGAAIGAAAIAAGAEEQAAVLERRRSRRLAQRARVRRWRQRVAARERAAREAVEVRARAEAVRAAAEAELAARRAQDGSAAEDPAAAARAVEEAIRQQQRREAEARAERAILEGRPQQASERWDDAPRGSARDRMRGRG